MQHQTLTNAELPVSAAEIEQAAAQLEGVAASTGMACHQGRQELSPVLKAMGIPEHVGLGAVRFSFGRHTTDAEVDALIGQLARLS